MWKWRIKYFASLCLFAFMGGLILGKVFKSAPEIPRLLHVKPLDSSLQLCFTRLPRVAVITEDGAFVMLLSVQPADEETGRLVLSGGDLASWHLVPRNDGMQLGVIGLQPVRAGWEKDADSPGCILLHIEPETGVQPQP